MELFNRKRVAQLEAQLATANAEIDRLREENRRLLCKINPHLESVFFPMLEREAQRRDLMGTAVTLTGLSIPDTGRCSLQMSEKNIRFCGTHKQDLDSQGRCPVTETTLFRKRTSPLIGKGRRILGSEFCRSRDQQFEAADAAKES